MLFSNEAGTPVCFHAESTATNMTEYPDGADIFITSSHNELLDIKY